MGLIASVLSFTRVNRNGVKVSEVKFDPGGNANIISDHFSSPGDDSFPLVTDYSISIDIPKTGGQAVMGYADPINTPKALEGDKRIYARDPSDGSVKVEIWLKNDGTTVISNDNGSMALDPGGDVIINGVTIDTNGNITTLGKVDADIVDAATSLKVNNKELDQHVHDAGALIDSVTSVPIVGITGVIP